MNYSFIYSESRTAIHYFEPHEEDLTRSDHLENMGADGKILLQWNFNKQVIY
jgi:hypothetical protein